MKSGFRQMARLLGAAALVAVSASPAFAQYGGGPRGRDVRVQQGRARPCPPGHERRGLCGWNDARSDRRDWCWDRNHDARCDRVSARVDRRRDDRWPRDDRRRGGWEDVRVQQRRDRSERGSLSDGLADLLRRSGIAGTVPR